jgi:hypothetical protein
MMGGPVGSFDEARVPEESNKRSALEHLDEELEILASTVELLQHRLEPVSTRYDRVQAVEKEVVPASAVRERVERVRQTRFKLDRMIEDLDI